MASYQHEKFKAAVHYVCANAPADFGRIKLHKALYFADMLHFIEKGAPLTGVDYIKQQFGPTARHLKSALDQLTSENKIEVQTENYFGYKKYNFISKSVFTSNQINEEEKLLLDEIVKFTNNYNATALSELSHNDAWQAVEIGEVIPYETAYWIIPTEVNNSDVRWAQNEINDIVT